MEAGRLNERITLLKFVPEKSATNQKKKGTYTPAFTVWAEVKCTQSTVTLDSGVIVYETVFRFNVRKRSDIDATMRISWKEKSYRHQRPTKNARAVASTSASIISSIFANSCVESLFCFLKLIKNTS